MLGALSRRFAEERGCSLDTPDTFLGWRWQAMRELLDDGVIGAPENPAAFVPTHEFGRHHLNAEFHFLKGSDPGAEVLVSLTFLYIRADGWHSGRK